MFLIFADMRSSHELLWSVSLSCGGTYRKPTRRNIFISWHRKTFSRYLRISSYLKSVYTAWITFQSIFNRSVYGITDNDRWNSKNFELLHQSEGVLSFNARLLKVFAVRQTFLQTRLLKFVITYSNVKSPKTNSQTLTSLKTRFLSHQLQISEEKNSFELKYFNHRPCCLLWRLSSNNSGLDPSSV